MPTHSPVLRPVRMLALLVAVLVSVVLAPAPGMPAAFAVTASRSSMPAAPPRLPHLTAQGSDIRPTDTITPTVSAGGSHSCGLKSNGQIICWGYDAFGQATGMPSGSFLAVSAGESHSCGILNDGSVSCWGQNASGQVAPVASGTFKDISAGTAHSCGVRTDGSLACWGDNSSGQVAPLPAGTFTQVSAGNMHSCALKDDGSIACWGNNAAGQAPETVPGGPFKQVSAGSLHSCAVKSDGSPFCWGDNSLAQVSPLPGGTFRQISAGTTHTCGLKTDDTVVCWGRNVEGQAGPTPSGPFTQVSAGGTHSCGVKNGNFYCWGKNDQGQAGNQIAPEITIQPTDKTVLAKSLLTLKVAASGTPAPIYQWRRNGAPIPGATQATYTVEEASSAHAGIYDVVVDNWMGSVTSNSVTVVVNLRTQALGFAEIGTKRYGDKPVELMATASSLLPVTFRLIAGPATIDGRFLTITGAGTITVRAEQGGNEFFTAAPPLTRTFLVERAPLTIRADDQVRLLGRPTPPLTASYIGLVNDDTPEDLDRPPTLTALAAIGSPPGEYPIVVTGAADADYDITMINGIMRIVRYQVHIPFVAQE